jgi:hypothetical protein
VGDALPFFLALPPGMALCVLLFSRDERRRTRRLVDGERLNLFQTPVSMGFWENESALGFA